MALQTTGLISLNDIQTEFGGANPIGLGEYYLNGAYVLSNIMGTIPASGAISLGNFYGGSNVSGKGYFGGGGYVSIMYATNEIDGIDFVTEVAFNPAAVLAVARSGPAGVNSSTKGYFGGGDLPRLTLPATNEIDGILFSNDTAFNPAAVLAVVRDGLTGVNSSTKGYFAGGVTYAANGIGTYSAEIDGILFSNDTTINPAAALAVAREWLAGANSSTKGYFAGGGNVAATTNEIDGIDFVTEVAFNPAAVLAVARSGLAGVNSSTKGYFGGGVVPGAESAEIDGINFVTEVAFNPAAVLAVARDGLTGVNSSTKGYFAGGTSYSLYYWGSISYTSTTEIDGILFSNDTAINPAAVLVLTRANLAGVNSGAL